MSTRCVVAIAGWLVCATPLVAQRTGLSGYYLNVGGGSARGPWSPGGTWDYQRLRAMAAPSTGRLRLDAAYEHTVSYERNSGARTASLAPGGAAASGDWLDLDWTIIERSHVRWRHRLDRLSAAVAGGAMEARVGRQAISWATTLFLTPADPFAPFDPSDPFREYRAGVDAARLQAFPGPFSSLDVVVRPARTPAGRTLTALARGKLTVARWDLSAWGGVLHDRAAGAAGVTGTVSGAAVRGELALRREPGRGTIARFAIGADSRWSVLRRDLYVVVEYQHDGFGAARASDLAAVAGSAPYLRGEMQVLGRDVAAAQARWQVHPLAGAELLVLADLRDGSLLLAPALSCSASDEVGLRAGVFLGAGRGSSPPGPPRSEFGDVPTSGYVSVSVFF